MDHVEDDWTFTECHALYVGYVRHLGNFNAIAADVPGNMLLMGRSIQEMRAKIRREHDFAVANDEAAPWALFHLVHPVRQVLPVGNLNAMLWGHDNGVAASRVQIPGHGGNVAQNVQNPRYGNYNGAQQNGFHHGAGAVQNPHYGNYNGAQQNGFHYGAGQNPHYGHYNGGQQNGFFH